MADEHPIARPSRSGPWHRRRSLTICIGIVLCYAFVLVVPGFVRVSNPLALTFNSMIDHLLQGRFDVDPAIVGKEGFARGGRVYAYWGILPALLRLPITVLPGWRRLDFTIPYCVVALFCMEAVKLWTVRFVLRHHAVPRALGRATCVVIALSGAQTCFFRFTVYQEVCLWAGVFASVFVAAGIVAQHRGFGRGERLVMAAAAGAALLTRVSTGIGLIAAFGLLSLFEAVSHRAQWREQLRQSMLPLLLLAIAGLATAGVNAQRWGSPLIFADYRYYLYNIQFPDRLARTAVYGLFNLDRVPFGIVYYFLPIWVLRGGDGHLLLEATRGRLLDSAELPPSSFLLTDPLLLLLGGIALTRWCRRRAPGGGPGGAVSIGLAIPPLLMLSAISMCFRYRMDFYPLIEFLAFSGLAMSGRTASWARPGRIWALAVISIVSSIAASIAYAASDLGPAQLSIGQGIGRYYLHRLGLS